MKVFLSTDIEGCAGIVDWDQVLATPAAEVGRRLLLGEVNAAIAGALDAGAQDVLVNDSHWTMQNLPPDELLRPARYLSGRHKPLYMMEGLDGSFDAAFFVAYHGSIGAERSVLSHTYNPSAVWEVRLNGRIVGEAAINALVALHHRVPVALVTGDRATAEEIETFTPGIEAVVVKQSVTRFAADSLHPEEARERIRAGARAALERAARLEPPAIELPARLDIVLLTADMAEMATWVRGIERTGSRSIAIEGDEPLAMYRTFVTLIELTRGIAEQP